MTQQKIVGNTNTNVDSYLTGPGVHLLHLLRNRTKVEILNCLSRRGAGRVRADPAKRKVIPVTMKSSPPKPVQVTSGPFARAKAFY